LTILIFNFYLFRLNVKIVVHKKKRIN